MSKYSQQRKLAARLCAILGAATVLITISTLHHLRPTEIQSGHFSPLRWGLKSATSVHSCTPEAWSSGFWDYQPPAGTNTSTGRPKVAKEPDALVLAGFPKCASTREYWWHLGVEDRVRWPRFPGVTSWKWVPGEQCQGFEERTAERMIKHLVEEGGWLLVGGTILFRFRRTWFSSLMLRFLDSVTENHFFSLSCLLSPHVTVSPDFKALGRFEHDWPQYIYLNPDSQLLDELSPPAGFDPHTTPLVAYRRVDLLLSREEVVNAHRMMNGTLKQDQLFDTKEKLFTVSHQDYMAQFFTPLPAGGYRTLIANTGAHWTTHLFIGLGGIEDILGLFETAMRGWAAVVGTSLALVNKKAYRGRDYRVLVRSYPPGHNNCMRMHYPLQEVEPFDTKTYNWDELTIFNYIMEVSTRFMTTPISWRLHLRRE